MTQACQQAKLTGLNLNQHTRPAHGGFFDSSLSEDSEVLDFSVNLNTLAPTICDSLWLKWKDALSHYPQADTHLIEEQLASLYQVAPEHLLCTHGGMSALDLAIRCSTQKITHLPAPCFSEYPYLSQIHKKPHNITSVQPQAWLDPKAWLRSIPENALVILSNPNNPTGSLIPPKILSEAIALSALQNTDWIIDEAFIDFTEYPKEYSMLSRLHKHPNLIIAGSLTKSHNIPGLRLGYLASANAPWLKACRQTQPSWSINALAECWVTHAITEDYRKAHHASLQTYASLRVDFQNALRSSQLIEPYPSECNFFLGAVNTDLISVPQLEAVLRKHKIIVRCAVDIPCLPQNFIRIAVRTQNHNKTFIHAIHTIEASL